MTPFITPSKVDLHVVATFDIYKSVCKEYESDGQYITAEI